MAVGTEEATYNAAVDVLIVAWEAMVDALAANEETQIVWVASKLGDNPGDSAQGSDATIAFDFGRRFYWRNDINTTDDMPFEIGGKPLFWKVTNAAGDL